MAKFIANIMAPAQEIHAKTPKKLVELTQMTEGEPGNLYVMFMGKLKKIAGRKLEQLVQVCSRPILHEQVWKSTEEKLEQEGVKVKCSAGQFYDPMSPAAELSLFTQQIKCYEQIKEGKREKFWDVMMGGLLGMLLGAGVAKFAKTSFAVEIVKIYFMAFGLLKVLGEVAERNTIMQFVHAELGRIRFAATSGNLVELLMRIEEKCSYMERRSMDFFANHRDFYRMLREKVILEIWQSQAAGREKFGYMVQSFLAQKKFRGGACSSKEKFIADIKRFLDAEAQLQIASTKNAKVNNGKFLLQLSTDVEEIAEEYEWFSAEIVWES